MGSEGCVAINTPQTISLERLALGEKPPPPPQKAPKPTAEQVKARQLEEARQKALAQQQKKQQAKEPPKPQSKELEAEEHDKIPEFDLQDIPGAMDKIGWPVSAKFARKWFASPKHTYNDQQNSIQPLDDTTVTLKWALKYGSVQKRFDELMGELIYTTNATNEIKKKVISQVKDKFIGQNSVNLSFDTTRFIDDVRQFHIDWQFQYKEISTFDTLDKLAMTDLTGALGSFYIYAAVGLVEVTAEKYFKYDSEQKTKAYCIDSMATVTHVYVYLKDNYSFNDKKGASKSQYLGHWNKKDMILSYMAGISGFIESNKINMGNSEIVNFDYLPNRAEVDKPVDKRTGMFRKLLEKDVYYPVYNKFYNDWREKHNRGGDFMIYSKPQFFKLKKPIILKLETICRPSESM